MMMERTVEIVNRNGLHARPAAEIVKLSSRFNCEITYGSNILVRANGPDAEQAVNAIADLVAAKFGER